MSDRKFIIHFKARKSHRSDQKDSNYPIFRNALPPDDIATLATCLFDLRASELIIYWGHPINEKEKRIEIPM